MADGDREPMPDRAISAMGERVAVVETKLGSLKDDTAIIRAALHAVNGEMQKFVGLEAQCVAHLGAIREQTAHLPEIVSKMVGLEGKVASFEQLQPRISTLIDESLYRKGGWKVVVMVCTASMGAVTMIGMVGAGIIWFLGKVVGH